MSSYHRVPSSSSSPAAAPHPQHQEDGIPPSFRRTSTPSERLRERVSAALWVGSAVMVARLSNFWTVVTLRQQPRGLDPALLSGGAPNATYSPPTSGGAAAAAPIVWLMQVAGIAVIVAILMGMYLVLYLPYVKGLTDPSAWPVYCPRVVPSMVGACVVAYVSLVRACWPVWGFLTPLIWAVEILGALFVTHLVPWPFGS